MPRPELSAVVLSNTVSQVLFEMTRTCIATLRDDVPTAEVIVVESNKGFEASDYDFGPDVKVIVPDGAFNFHRFLNIGINAASGVYIGLFNNDLIFAKHWFSAMMDVGRQHRNILSFSPIGHPSEAKPGIDFEIGYKVMTHVKGWCIVAHRSVFKKIGNLDEDFDFYFADNDYAMTLKSQNVRHALVYRSVVTHLAKKSTPAQNNDRSHISRYELPGYLNDPKYDWVLSSERNLSGFLTFHNKWGDPDWLYRKNKLADWCQKLRLGFLIPIFFKLK